MLSSGPTQKSERCIVYIHYMHVHSQSHSLILVFTHSLFWYQHQAFSYVHAVMNEDQYSEADREEVSRAMLDKFQVYMLGADY